jgi:UDP:flavonoid glycosyltransferase YjiC (YdhE family)
MILIPTPSHTEQMNNARRTQEMGIAEVIEQSDVNAETLLKTVNKILSDDSYRRNIEKIRESTMEMNGLKTIVDIIVNVAEGRIT